MVESWLRMARQLVAASVECVLKLFVLGRRGSDKLMQVSALERRCDSCFVYLFVYIVVLGYIKLINEGYKRS